MSSSVAYALSGPMSDTPNARLNSAVSTTVLAIHAFGSWCLRQPRGVRLVLWPLYRAIDLVVVKLMANADVPAECVIGTKFVLAHGGKGTVLADSATIGDRVTVYHQVTVARGATISHDVWVGPGAKILEGVSVGHDVKIGANAVVNADIPAGCTAVGVPARIVTSMDDS